MRELSLHIMDIVENSINANATIIEIYVLEDTLKNSFVIKVKDNGKGMSEEILKNVKDPFFTTRTTRKVGLGLSLFESTCLRCNGNLKINSEIGKGTEVIAYMEYNHIDRPPLGRIEDTIVSILLNPNVDLIYEHSFNGKKFKFDSREVKKVLGLQEINNPEILLWLKEFIRENITEIGGGAS
ncbi:Histidine kinase-, DNA gyrase B-, and HSP90-like ATPase [Caloramator fervidus]|uniref:histidine kinase n=1 Tax=Caloramator fervidus TaxID=29344 RepID=A0A1H5XC66_9CLOT|nr:ATP-binding protein [Caloramator fervidus]SEG09332.1 Histidine kinase-, DNA gyrase B-, and HSP90-like ATPase [Caloramator fervidus]